MTVKKNYEISVNTHFDLSEAINQRHNYRISALCKIY